MILNMRYCTEEQQRQILSLYESGLSGQEIVDQLHLSITCRSVQRFIKANGLIRSGKDAYHNAIKRGRVHWALKENKKHRLQISPILRYKILQRDNFRCVACGATAKDRLLEVDHINGIPDDNREENLQVLCEFCNFGKR